jgi:hypothetical protein
LTSLIAFFTSLTAFGISFAAAAPLTIAPGTLRAATLATTEPTSFPALTVLIPALATETTAGPYFLTSVLPFEIAFFALLKAATAVFLTVLPAFFATFLAPLIILPIPIERSLSLRRSDDLVELFILPVLSLILLVLLESFCSLCCGF